MIKILIIFVLNCFLLINCDKLVHLQSLYRHGDRAPLGTYRTDPYQEDSWPVAWGELTVDGMSQHYQQGLKFQDRYMHQLQFLVQNYSSKDIIVRSTHVDRTLMSAYSQLAGLYSNSIGTHPNNPHWPTNWSPIPVNTVEHKTDSLLNPGFDCMRMDILEAEQLAHPEFLKYLAANLDFLNMISEKTGDTIKDFKALYHFFDSIKIEKIHNMTLPSWITDNVYSQAETISMNVQDFFAGSAGFNKNENVELIKLKGGDLLNTMINNIENALNNSTNQPKFHMYSAHDITVAAFLRTLGTKNDVLGLNEPDFAALLTVELWDDHGKPYVKVWYSDNVASNFRDITKYISNCGNTDKCYFEDFKQRSKPYISTNIIKDCDKL